MNDRDIFMNAPDGASPEELEDYLDILCGDDGEMRARVEALFEASRQGEDVLTGQSPLESFVEKLESEDGGGAKKASQSEEHEGSTIGNYKLKKRIGEGGYGVVYMADQLEPVERLVAFKIIKMGMDTKRVVARFELERQALARMDHPNIARVFDAGSTDSGRPYFVMELVHGVPITKYCDEHSLGTTARLELYIDVCKAVQHAHVKGIIHRDLKPSNILVSVVDGRPVPKIIDFGIAKATQVAETGMTEKSLLTWTVEVVGTPEYMSPEQAGSAGNDVDTRCDVYSLGATLYELLTGEPPIRLRDGADFIGEMLRRIREEVPQKPSARITRQLTRITAADEGSVGSGDHTGATIGTTQRRVAGDLDWIVLRALEKERSRRYQRPVELAEDLRAFLDNRPVSARAPSLAYRGKKFVQRHRNAFAVAGVFALMSAVAASVAWGAYTKSRDEAAVDLYLQSEPEHARRLLPQLQLGNSEIQRMLREADGTRGRLALATLDPAIWGELENAVWTAPVGELPLFFDAAEQQDGLSEAAWEILGDASARRKRRLNAAAALARFDPNNPRWEELGVDVIFLMVVEDPGLIGEWMELLKPAQDWLKQPLMEFVGEAIPTRFGTLASAISRLGDSGMEGLAEEALRPIEGGTEPELDTQAKRRARYAMMQLWLGDASSILKLLERSPPDDPRIRSYIIHGLADYQFDPYLVSSLALATQRADVKRGLIAALGGFDELALGVAHRRRLRESLHQDFITNPDPGVHFACAWLFRRWGFDEGLDAQQEMDLEKRSWWIDPRGFTMVSPEVEGLPRFAIGTTHVSVDQYKRFDPDLSKLPVDEGTLRLYAVSDDCPIVYISVQLAMEYCNWLSEQSGLQQCYVPDAAGEELVTSPKFPRLSGYRLPLENEWVAAVMGGSNSELPYGSDRSLAPLYFQLSSLDPKPNPFVLRPCGELLPNDYGLFDGLGLALQRCHAEVDVPPFGPTPLIGSSIVETAEKLNLRHRDSDARLPIGIVTSFRIARTILK